MMREKEARELLRRNVKKHGSARQLVKLMEELGELTQVCAKLFGEGDGFRKEIDHMAEEIADVEIMIEQMRIALPELRERERAWTERKMQRIARGLREGH